MNRQAKKLQPKAKRHSVTCTVGNRFWVTSATSGRHYIVNSNFRCSCQWSRYHPNLDCTHTLAVREFLKQEEYCSLSFWSDPKDAARQHRHTENLTPGLIATERRNYTLLALTAIANSDNAALIKWLEAHNEIPSRFPENNILRVALIASGPTFENNPYKQALRNIRAYSLVGAAAAEVARAALSA